VGSLAAGVLGYIVLKLSTNNSAVAVDNTDDVDINDAADRDGEGIGIV
jgi:hypothetical protein